MSKEDKIKRVKELYKEQSLYAKKIHLILKLSPGKRPSTEIKRGVRIIKYLSIIRMLETQKLIVISQPIAPNFKKGGCAIVGKKGEEAIINRTGKIIKLTSKK